MEETRIRSVEHAKAIFTWRYIEVREYFAVDEASVAENFGNPPSVSIARYRIKELALRSKETVGNRQRNFIFSVRQLESVFRVVSHDVHAHQSRENIKAVNTHRVIVIPQHRRVLLVRVVIQGRFPRNNPILGIAVAFGRRFSAVKVYHGANFRLVRASPGKVVVYGKKMPVG